MMKDQTPLNRMWNMYKKGGITSAIASVFETSNAQQVAFLRSFMKHQRKKTLWEQPLADLEVVVFDLETTGFYPQHGDEILSIGAVGMKGGQIFDETFHTYIQIDQNVPELITKLTGISDDMVNNGEELIEALQHFFQFVHRRVLMAHGAGHDKSFMDHALRKTSRTSYTHRTLDTMMIAKWLQPGLKEYSLDTLLELYNIPITKRHDALEDSKMTAQLWSCFLQQIREKQVTTLGDLYMYLSR